MSEKLKEMGNVHEMVTRMIDYVYYKRELDTLYTEPAVFLMLEYVDGRITKQSSNMFQGTRWNKVELIDRRDSL